MTTRFVGQAVDGLWAAGTSSARYPNADLDEFGYPNLAAALAAANANDTLLLQPGTYTFPTITIPLTIRGQDRTSTIINATEVDADNVLFDSLYVAGLVTVKGSAGFVKCVMNPSLTNIALATGDGCVVTAGCQGTAVADTTKAAATNYPLLRDATGGGGRYSARYRTWVTVQAPAVRRQSNGQAKIAKWISLGRLIVRMEEATAREAVQARLLIANATGRCFAKSGSPVSNEFRLVTFDSRVLEVRSVVYMDPPMAELEIAYSEVAIG